MGKTKTFLVTGATGLIGSHIIEKLLDTENARIIALSLTESKLKKMFGKYEGGGKLECIAKDMGIGFDLDSISPDSPVDVVFHAASPISRQMFREQPVNVIRPNLIAMESILEGLVKQQRETGINGRLVVFSSIAVYGMNSECDITISEPDTQYTEGLNGVNIAYSESKRMVEVMSQAYAKQYNVDVVIARLSAVYGATPYPPDIPIYEFINNAFQNEDIRLKSSGLPKRDNIYIDDTVSAIFAILEKGKTAEAYNVGGNLENFVPYDEIAEIIAEVSSKELSNKIKVIYESPRTQSRKPGIMLDTGKLESLGWKPSVGLYDGLRSTILRQREYLKNL